jgi:hypothetical protein
MRQKHRLYNRQLFDATITIGRHILIRNDVAEEAFVIQNPVGSRTPKSAHKVHCITYQYVNRWLTLLLWETDENKHPVYNCLKKNTLRQVVNNYRSFGGVCCSNLQSRSNTKLQVSFRNVGKYLRTDTASCARRLKSSATQLSGSEISQFQVFTQPMISNICTKSSDTPENCPKCYQMKPDLLNRLIHTTDNECQTFHINFRSKFRAAPTLYFSPAICASKDIHQHILNLRFSCNSVRRTPPPEPVILITFTHPQTVHMLIYTHYSLRHTL